MGDADFRIRTLAERVEKYSEHKPYVDDHGLGGVMECYKCGKWWPCPEGGKRERAEAALLRAVLAASRSGVPWSRGSRRPPAARAAGPGAIGSTVACDARPSPPARNNPDGPTNEEEL